MAHWQTTSVREIAAALNRTRNSCIGRARRLKLRMPVEERWRRCSPWPGNGRRSTARQKRMNGFYRTPPLDPMPEPRRVALFDLQSRDCRWIVEGDREHAKFCGLPTVALGQSWCPWHDAKVWGGKTRGTGWKASRHG